MVSHQSPSQLAFPLPVSSRASRLISFVEFTDREVTVTRYEPAEEDNNQRVQVGNSVEVRGLVKNDTELQYSDLNRFEGDFDMGSYEQMLDYYHGMCTHLCVQQEVI